MEEVPLLIELQKKYAKDATIVGISIDPSLDRVDRTIKAKGMTYPILADGKGFDGPIPKAYHIQGTPEVFVIDREGKIFARLPSARRLDATLKEAIGSQLPASGFPLPLSAFRFPLSAFRFQPPTSSLRLRRFPELRLLFQHRVFRQRL